MILLGDVCSWARGNQNESLGMSGLPEDSANSGRGDCNKISSISLLTETKSPVSVATDAADDVRGT